MPKKLVVAFLLISFSISGFAVYTSPSPEKIFYRFNESTGEDFSGNNNDATILNSPTFGVSGVNSNTKTDLKSANWGDGEAWSFSASNGDAAYKNITLTGSRSMSCWINTDSLDGNFYKACNLWHQQNPVSARYSFLFQITSSNDISIEYENADSLERQVVVDSPSTNTWYHLAATYNGSHVEGFLNGNSVFKTSLTDSLNTSNRFEIAGGDLLNNGGSWNGEIDEPRFANESWTNQEVSNLYKYNQYTTPSSNSNPSLSNFDPVDGATGVNDTDDSQGIDVDISVDYSDSDGDAGTVYIYNSSNPSQVFKKSTSVSSGSTVSSQLEDLAEGTTFGYKVNASDGNGGTVTSAEKTFTTVKSTQGVGEYYELPGASNTGFGSDNNVWAGSVINPNQDVFIEKINVLSGLESGATCKITDDGGGTVLESVTGSGDNISFSGNTKLNAGTSYRVICDSTHYYGKKDSTYPYSYDFLDISDGVYGCNSDGTGCTSRISAGTDDDFSQWYGILASSTDSIVNKRFAPDLLSPSDGISTDNKTVNFQYDLSGSTPSSTNLYLNRSDVDKENNYGSGEVLFAQSGSYYFGDPDIEPVPGTGYAFLAYWNVTSSTNEWQSWVARCEYDESWDPEVNLSSCEQGFEFVDENNNWETGSKGIAVQGLEYNPEDGHLYATYHVHKKMNGIGIARSNDPFNASSWEKISNPAVPPDNDCSGGVQDGSLLFYNKTTGNSVNAIIWTCEPTDNSNQYIALATNNTTMFTSNWNDWSGNPLIEDQLGSDPYQLESTNGMILDGKVYLAGTNKNSGGEKVTSIYESSQGLFSSYTRFSDDYVDESGSGEEGGRGISVIGDSFYMASQFNNSNGNLGGSIGVYRDELTTDWAGIATDSNPSNSSTNVFSEIFDRSYNRATTRTWAVEASYPDGTTNISKNRSIELQSFTTSDTTPSSVNIDSPLNQTYSSSEVDLNVTSDEAVSNWEYSLDEASNQTFTPNTTIFGLSDGAHTVDVYATDTSGNTGSESVTFNVNTENPSFSINYPLNGDKYNYQDTETGVDINFYGSVDTSFSGSLDVLVDGSSIYTKSISSGSNSYTYTQEFTQGTYDSTVKITSDKTGSTYSSSTNTFTVDEVSNPPPVINKTVYQENISQGDSLDFNLLGSDYTQSLDSYSFKALYNGSTVDTATGSLNQQRQWINVSNLFTAEKPGTYTIQASITDNNAITTTENFKVNVEEGNVDFNLGKPNNTVETGGKTSVNTSFNYGISLPSNGLVTLYVSEPGETDFVADGSETLQGITYTGREIIKQFNNISYSNIAGEDYSASKTYKWYLEYESSASGNVYTSSVKSWQFIDTPETTDTTDEKDADLFGGLTNIIYIVGLVLLLALPVWIKIKTEG